MAQNANPVVAAKRPLNEADAAEFLGVTTRAMQDWRRKGRGPVYFKVGHVVRYRESDLTAWLETCKVEPVNASAGCR